MRKLKASVPYILLGLSLLLLIFLNVFCQDHWLDSDMAAEMIFSKLLAEEGHFFATPNWYYSTEFRFLYTHLLMGPLFRVTDNWHLIRMVVNLVFYGAMLGSYFYFVKPLRLRKSWSVLTSVILLLPFSETMMTHMHMGNTYLSHVIIAFLYFGMFLRLAEKGEYSSGCKYVTAVGFAVLSLICGISGVRYLLALQCPMLLASFVYLAGSDEFHEFRNYMSREKAGKVYGCERAGYLKAALPGFLFSLAGYAVNVLWVSRHYVFQTYGATNFISIYQGDLFERMQNAFGCLLMLFGYIPDRGFLSLRGLISILSFVILGIFVFCVVKNLGRTKGKRYFVTLFTVTAFLLNVFVFVFTTSTMVPRYYITILIFALPAAAFYEESDEPLLDRRAIALVLACCLMLGTAKVTASFATSDKNENRRPVAAFLKEEGYSFGFATYNNANIITELTDGAVEIANIGDPEYLGYFRWSSPVRYYQEDYHQGEVFLLLTSQEAEQFTGTLAVQTGKCVYDDGYYVVLLYESREALMNCAR